MKLIREKEGLLFDPQKEGVYMIHETGKNEILTHQGKLVLKSDEVHPVYEVSFGNKKYRIGEQLIRAVEIMNFRDLGGFVNEEGKQVKYGCFYRSSPIILNDHQKEAFEKLKIHSILDLRSDEEVKEESDAILENIHYIHKSAICDDEFNSNLNMSALLEKSDFSKLSDYMKRMYELLPFHNEAYQCMFDLMLSQKVPFVFHCSAGKDRTGVGAYLILKTLGVSDEDIMDDYLMSNVYLAEKNEMLIQHFSSVTGLEELLGVKEEYLFSSMNAIMKRYSDFYKFIREEYGIDEEKVRQLRKMYLYGEEYD